MREPLNLTALIAELSEYGDAISVVYSEESTHAPLADLRAPRTNFSGFNQINIFKKIYLIKGKLPVILSRRSDRSGPSPSTVTVPGATSV